MTKKGFIFYFSFYDAICELPEEMQLHLYNAIMRYSFFGEGTELSPVEKGYFKLIRPQLDANQLRYENGRKGAEYGKLGGEYGSLGGRPRKNIGEETPQKPPKNPPKEKEKEKEKDCSYPPLYSPQGEGSSVRSDEHDEQERTIKALNDFHNRFPSIELDIRTITALKGVDIQGLSDRISESKSLQKINSLSTLLDHYDRIMQGVYADD